jgi:hypothetical protein
MTTSEILRHDHEDMIELYKRMKPEERLVAFFYHAQLTHQMYWAGVTHRAGAFPLPKRDRPEK